MTEQLVHALALVALFGLSGAAFTFGVALVGRWLRWAPINVTVNIYKRDEEES